MNTCSSIKDLRNSQFTGTVFVSGYYKDGDYGGGYYFWDSNNTKKDNGGTVISSSVNPNGRWVLMHNGELDFNFFGIFDESTPADDALDAMVNDESVKKINAFNNLLFQKRHRFNRSKITIDFNNHHISTQGIEPVKSDKDDPFAAVLFFQGTISTIEETITLTENLKEQTDVFPVSDSSKFKVGDWYALEVNKLSGSYERELQKLVQVISIIDGNHIQIGYQNGWELNKDRIISWRKVIPISDVSINNLHFSGAGNDKKTGSHPIAFEYAIYANVFNIHSVGTFWPMVMRRWNTHYITEQCSLMNPVNVEYGGAGVLTQQIYCLYGHVKDCYVANARHLNDFVAAANCMVENCHADGQSAVKGPFVTHGQYEHDLNYTGNSGLMTFANSGTAWGGRAKRINVRKHICPWFIARSKITDLTLEDVVVISKEDIPNSGILWVNADGLQMRGCSSNKGLKIVQVSSDSSRPNLISGCAFTLDKTQTPITEKNVNNEIVITDSLFYEMNGHSFNSSASLIFRRCHLYNSRNSEKIQFAANKLSFMECNIKDGKLTFIGDTEKHLIIHLTTISSSEINFINFNLNPFSSLIFSHNRLTNNTIVNKPITSERVIWESNIVN